MIKAVSDETSVDEIEIEGYQQLVDESSDEFEESYDADVEEYGNSSPKTKTVTPSPVVGSCPDCYRRLDRPSCGRTKRNARRGHAAAMDRLITSWAIPVPLAVSFDAGRPHSRREARRFGEGHGRCRGVGAARSQAGRGEPRTSLAREFLGPQTRV